MKGDIWRRVYHVHPGALFQQESGDDASGDCLLIEGGEPFVYNHLYNWIFYPEWFEKVTVKSNNFKSLYERLSG